jgi:cell division septation protein DedD
MSAVAMCDEILDHKKTSDGIYRDENGEVYYEKSGDVVYEWTETDGIDAIVTDIKQKVPVTTIVDGKVVTVYKTSKAMSDTHTKFKKVRRIWAETVEVPSIARVLEGFGEYLGEISPEQYTLFSNIATTDYNKYWSDYNFWEIKDMDLGLALSKLSAVYKSAIKAEDIDLAVEAIQRCDDGYVALVLDSSSIDVNNQDGWTIYSEFFAATCHQKSNVNQVFAWAASKSGGYLPGAFSQSNANTITYIVKKWLLMHIPMLVSCKSSPVKQMHIWKKSEVTVVVPPLSSVTASVTAIATAPETVEESATATATAEATPTPTPTPTPTASETTTSETTVSETTTSSTSGSD